MTVTLSEDYKLRLLEALEKHQITFVAKFLGTHEKTDPGTRRAVIELVIGEALRLKREAGDPVNPDLIAKANALVVTLIHSGIEPLEMIYTANQLAAVDH